MVLFFFLLILHITFINFHTSNQPCIPWINSIWSWYISFLIRCWIWFVSILSRGFFISIIIRDIGQRFYFLVMPHFGQGDTGLIERVGKCSFLFFFMDDFYEEFGINYFKIFDRLH